MDMNNIDLKTIVTISLPDTGAEIVIHKDILCAHSDFAKACLDSGFSEGHEGKIVLKDEDDEESLRILVGWMYQGTAVLPSRFPDDSPYPDAILKEIWQWIIKLYIMTDRYMMTGFKNDILLHCLKLRELGHIIYGEETMTVLTQRPPSCNLRRLCFDSLVRSIGNEALIRNEKHLDTREFKSCHRELCQAFISQPELASSILCSLLQPELPPMKPGDYLEDSPTASRCDSSAVAGSPRTLPDPDQSLRDMTTTKLFGLSRVLVCGSIDVPGLNVEMYEASKIFHILYRNPRTAKQAMIPSIDVAQVSRMHSAGDDRSSNIVMLSLPDTPQLGGDLCFLDFSDSYETRVEFVHLIRDLSPTITVIERDGNWMEKALDHSRKLLQQSQQTQ